MSSSSALISHGNQAVDIRLAVDEDSTPEHFQTPLWTPVVEADEDPTPQDVLTVTTHGDTRLDVEVDEDPTLQDVQTATTPENWQPYIPLCEAILGGKWKKARDIIEGHRPYATAVITARQETALHLAVRTGYSTLFVKHLLPMMSDDNYSILTHKDIENHTVLAVSAVVGNIKVARRLVRLKPELLHIEHDGGELPVHIAAEHGPRLMLVYLLETTRANFPEDTDESTFFSRYGAKLVKHMITSRFVDLALVEVQNHTEIATSEEGISVLAHLATTPEVFRSGSSNPNSWPHPNNSMAPRRIFGVILMHQKSVELVRFMVGKIAELNNPDILVLLQKVVLPAANLGIHEVVEETISSIPLIIWVRDPITYKGVFEEAIEMRHVNVFNLIYQTNGHYQHFQQYKDDKNNNILHFASKLAPRQRLDGILGAALQMQRELQWFKAVQKLVKPCYQKAKNSDGKTPRELFSDEHKSLKTDGEEWLKSTAKSCSVVAALIATVVITTMIAVGHATNSTANQNLYKGSHFQTFFMSSFTSIVFSIFSILSFTAVLNARYAEDDFLRGLQIKLTFGLLALAISIGTTILSFFTSLYFLFGNYFSKLTPFIYVYFLLFLAAGFQVLSVSHMFRSAWSRTNFRKKSHRIIY